MSVFIIAEAGVNMNGRLDHALALVKAAAAASADAVKFQAFTPFRLAPLNDEKRALLKWLALTKEELVICAAETRYLGMEFLVTPMDPEWLAFVVGTLRVGRIKIGSAQVNDEKFMRDVADTELPVIMSNGMSDNREFCAAVQRLLGGGLKDLTLLSCVSRYPTPPTDICLGEIARLKDLFPAAKVGFSSHCPSPWPSVAAAYAGPVVLENHITLDRGMQGPDHTSSLTPEEFKVLVREVRRVG